MYMNKKLGQFERKERRFKRKLMEEEQKERPVYDSEMYKVTLFHYISFSFC